MARGGTKEQAKIAERVQLALEYRRAGNSYRWIGNRLGVSYEQARRDVENELKRLAAERQDSAEELRQLELERCDMLLAGLEPMATVGNPGAVNSFLRVMERRAKLLGLDAPVKQDVTSGGDKITFAFVEVPSPDGT